MIDIFTNFIIKDFVFSCVYLITEYIFSFLFFFVEKRVVGLGSTRTGSDVCDWF